MATSELVHVQTRDGVQLDGILDHASGPTTLGIDLVIFHHGVGSNFYRTSMAGALTDQFIGEGCSMLRVNNRGHDHLYSSPNGWLGAAFETVDDCRLDFAAWLDFARAAGHRRILLWGHSLGAVKLIYYLAQEQDLRIAGAIASSPPRFHFQSFVDGEGEGGRAASIAEAEALLADGHPDGLVTFDLGLARPMWFCAHSALDKYGPKDRYDFFRHLPEVKVPLLLTIGGLEDGFSFDALAAEGPELARRYSWLSFASVAGADHLYMSHTAEVWSLARDWLKSSIHGSTS